MSFEPVWKILAWLFCFVILLLVSKYAIDRMSQSRMWAYLFLIVSYVQGLLLALTFKIPINFFNYFPDLFTPIPVAVMFGIFYFFLFLALLNIYNVYSNKTDVKVEDFVDNETKEYITKIWKLKQEQIKIVVYDDGNCPNVQREISKGCLIIHVGKNFIKLVNDAQLKFAFSHEVAHFKGRNYRMLFIIVCLGYIVFTCFIGQVMASNFGSNPIFFVIITFALFILGLMTLNYLKWHDEYSADYNGASKLKGIQNFESFFQIEEFVQPDHGLLFDLIFYDHPSSERRLQNLKK
jgi:Zn-dependent protease with chaperone function